MKQERKYSRLRNLLYIATGPWDLVIWFTILIIRALWGNKLWWSEGTLWTEFKPNSWPSRSWYRIKVDGGYLRNPDHIVATRGPWRTWGGTTFGHGGIYGPGVSKGEDMDTSTEFHEHVHVEQYEVFSVFSFIAACVTAIVLFSFGQVIPAVILCSLLWLFGGIFGFTCSTIVAVLRGEPAYRGSALEKHAYAVDQELLKDFLESNKKDK